MVPITRRVSSFLVFFVCKLIERRRRKGRQNNNRSINLPKVITFFTDYSAPPNPNLNHTQYINTIFIYIVLITFILIQLEKWRASSLLVFLYTLIERRRRRGRQSNNNRPINLPKVITFLQTTSIYQHYIYIHTCIYIMICSNHNTFY